MANQLVLDGLLKTPDQVRKEQQQQLRNEAFQRSQQMISGGGTTALPGLISRYGAQAAQRGVEAGAGLLRGVTGGIGTAVGGELGRSIQDLGVSTEERQARQAQEAMKGMVSDDPTSIKATAMKLRQLGLTSAADQLDQRARRVEMQEQELGFKRAAEARAERGMQIQESAEQRAIRGEVRAESAEERAERESKQRGEVTSRQIVQLDAQINEMNKKLNDRVALEQKLPEVIQSIPEAFMSKETKKIVEALPSEQALPYIMDAQKRAQAKVARDSYYKSLSSTIFKDMTTTTVDDTSGEASTQMKEGLTNNQVINRLRAGASKARRDGYEQVAKDLEARILDFSGGLPADKIGEKTLEFKEKYEGDERIKAVEESLKAARQVMTSAAMQSGAGDIATIFQFMKSLDPRSVVREGEFQLAEGIGGVFTRLEVLANKAKDGERLTDTQRKEIVNLTAQLAAQNVAYGNQVRDRERQAYNVMGLDIDVITGKDLFEEPKIPDVFSKQTEDSKAATATQEEEQSLMEVWG